MRGYAITAAGARHAVNQDSYLMSAVEDCILAVVCDGVGGERAGDVASRVAVDRIEQVVREGYRPEMDGGAVKNLLQNALSSGNDLILEMAEGNLELSRMGTTAVAALVRGRSLAVAHAGDTRAYLLSAAAQQLTKDHTVAQFLYDQGELSRKEYETYPEKNIITRALGVERTLISDSAEREIAPGERVLICSDGFYKTLTDDEIAGVHDKEDLERLAQLSVQRGCTDDITAILLTD